MPLLRRLGSRLEYIILIGLPLIGVKLSISRARAAAGYFKISMKPLQGIADVQQEGACTRFYKAMYLKEKVSHGNNSSDVETLQG